MRKSEERPASVPVEIFGVVYPLRAGGDPERLRELALAVDARMREAAAQAPGADRGRLAILAALNLADELVESRSQAERDRRECFERVAQLADRLGLALG